MLIGKRTPAPDMPAWLSTMAGAVVQFTESNMSACRKEKLESELKSGFEVR
jgi:hypothetical protein